MLGKIQQRKKAFWAKYNGEKRKGFGKIHTKKTCWAKYNRERRHFGQNTMEKSVKVSAKYIQKKTCWAKYNREKAYNGEKRRGFGKIHTKKNVWAKYNVIEVSAKYI